MGSSNISTWDLDPERCFAPDPTQRQLAGDVFTHVRNLPLICPHGHVIPSCIANDSGLGSPSDLFVISDHYVFRMLHSQGIALEDLGIPSNDGRLVEVDHRQIWQKFSASPILSMRHIIAREGSLSSNARQPMPAMDRA